MTTSGQPNSRRNLDKAINRLSQGDDDARRIRLVMANAIVGQLLPSGVVKGGSALKLRYGNDTTRFTRDLDAARNVDLEEFVSQLRKRLEVGWNGFTGSVVKRKPAKPVGVPSRYVMQPFDVKLQYNRKSWLTVPLEVGHNEIGDASEPEYGIAEDIVSLFLSLGFPAPDPVALMPLHYQVAQKLHGVSEPGSDRAHDLVDLQVMVLESGIEYSKVKEICIRLFAYRCQQAWPPVIRKNEDWDQLYENQVGGLPVAGSVDEAIDWANDLVTRIDAAS